MTIPTRSEDLTLPLVLAAAIPVLVLRLGVVFLRLKRKRRGGVRAFRKALLRGGMRREDAARLADQFASYGRLRSYLPEGMGLRGLPIKF